MSRIESLIVYYEAEKEKLDRAKQNLDEVKKEIIEEMDVLGLTTITQETHTGARWNVTTRTTTRETVTKEGKHFLKNIVIDGTEKFIKTLTTTSTVIKKVK